jgi:hypothetical protein
MSEELIRNLARRLPSAFFAGIRALRADDLRTRVSRLTGIETLRCGVTLAQKFLENPEGDSGISDLGKCEKVLSATMELAERLVAAGVFVSGKLMVKVFLCMAESAKICGRRDDQIVHLQQALEICDSDESQKTAVEMLLTEALVETRNFSAAKYIGERLYDRLRRRGRWISGGDGWDALEYVIVLSLVLQISLALNDRSDAKLYLDLATAVGSLVQSRSPQNAAIDKIRELVDKMHSFARRFSHDH